MARKRRMRKTGGVATPSEIKQDVPAEVKKKTPKPKKNVEPESAGAENLDKPAEKAKTKKRSLFGI
jgi:hypothetical protein